MARTIAKGEARSRIIVVAAELIAAHGVDGVSIRGINTAAGVSPATLHYHFGTLDNVVEAILETEMAPLMERRLEMYESFSRSGTDLSARTICEILAVPLAKRVIESEDDGYRYVKLLARLHNDDHPGIYTFSLRYFGQRAPSVPELFYRAVPHLPREIVAMRATAASYAMLNTLAHLHQGPRERVDAEPPINRKLLWQRVHALIDFLSNAMEAPVSQLRTSDPDGTYDENWTRQTAVL